RSAATPRTKGGPPHASLSRDTHVPGWTRDPHDGGRRAGGPGRHQDQRRAGCHLGALLRHPRSQVHLLHLRRTGPRRDPAGRQEQPAPGERDHRGARARPLLLPLSRRRAMRAMQSALIALAAVSLAASSSRGLAMPGASDAPLPQEVRRAPAKSQDVSAAPGAGYALSLGCVSSPQDGAMGIPYVNADLVGDGKLDAARPEALMYEP